MEVGQGPRRLLARRRRPPAPRHGQEDQGGDGRAARALRRAAPCERARRTPRRTRSSTCSPSSPTTASTRATPPPTRWSPIQTAYLKANHPRRVPRRVDDARPRQHRQARRIPPRGAASRHPGRAALDQPLGRRVRRRLRREAGAIRYALAADQGRRPAGGRGPRRGAGRRAVRATSPTSPAALNPRVVNKRTLENLVAAGALDELEPDRARACAAVDAMMSLAQQARGGRRAAAWPTCSAASPRPTCAARSRRISPGPRRCGCSGNTMRSASSSRAIRSTSTASS